MEGQHREINFAGRIWIVKRSHNEPIHPGPNHFSHSEETVWVQNVQENGNIQEYLHLKIRRINGVWHSAEVALNESLGYGRYIIHNVSRVDALDPNVVFGISTYDEGAPQANHRQVNLQLSQWGDPDNQIGQFVVQPQAQQGNKTRFPVNLNGHWTSQIIDWTADRVCFQMLHDHLQFPPANYMIIRQWASNQNIERGNERFTINLWQVNGQEPADGQEVEVVIKSFRFIPHN